MRALLLLTYSCVLLAATNEASAPSKPDADLEHALQEFQSETAALGIRPLSGDLELKPRGVKPAWHGRIFENFRNDALDAIPHEIRQSGRNKALLHRNQFGFNVSGPVIIPHLWTARNNTFFSLSYEGVRERIARTYLRTVPTLGERAGDFSQTVEQAGNPLLIYDPAATHANSNYDPSQVVSATNLQYRRDPFPGNRIPSYRLDRVATQAVGLYPKPNTNIGPFFQNNFFINSPETNIADGFLGKIDQTVADRHRLTVDFNISNGHYGAPQWFPTIANPGPP